MRHLWQRIFAYSLILVVVSQAAAFFLHRYAVSRDETRRYITDYARSMAASVEGENAATADAILRVFNHKRNRAWIEDETGELVAGARPEDARPESANAENARPENTRPGNARPGNTRPASPGPLHAMDAGEKSMSSVVLGPAREDMEGYIAATPISLGEGPAKLFLYFRPPRLPDLWTVFFQGLVFVSVIGLLLAFWMARRVSRPLRTLRDEVLEIAGGNLDRRVSVHGHDEITDVATAVNQMADNLARHIRSMRELVANISHEMRSPLARVQVSLAMLEEDAATLPKAVARLSRISEELAHMNKLIGNTLLSSKLDLNAPPRPEGPVAFSGLCAEACRRHEDAFTKAQICLKTAIQPEITFPGDETLLTTLVANLLDNAAKYTAPGQNASLRLFRDGEKAVLQVANDHAPLADTVLEHIFDPFYRGGVATGTGVGLGLSLVRKIAQLHGGDIFAANSATGLCFTAVFPLAP